MAFDSLSYITKGLAASAAGAIPALPVEADVRLNVQFGIGGIEFTGSLIAKDLPTGLSFEDQMANDSKDVFMNILEFGEQITVTEPGEAARPIMAVVDREPFGQMAARDGQGTVEVYEIDILSDADDGVADPTSEHTFTIDGKDWRPQDATGIKLDDGDGIHTVTLFHWTRTRVGDEDRQRIGR